jgi:stage II sporulation protein D
MNKKLLSLNLIFLSLVIINISGCSSGSRYAEKENTSIPSKTIPIRVLISDKGNNLNYFVENPVVLYNDEKEIAIIKKGNILTFSQDRSSIILSISDKTFESKYFELKSQATGKTISFDGKNYEGLLKIISDGENVKVINRISLEDYLKGVVPAEMPTGSGDSYFQALKAFSICARTYAVMKMGSNNSFFDVYLDTRDQVYDGTDVENPLSDKAVDETKNLILTYGGKPATVFYSAACGGHTEDAGNVFAGVEAPYLKGVKDGDPPNCSIEPGFNWQEIYTSKTIVDMLKSAGYISNENYILKNIEVKSRFESGRVNILQITLNKISGEEKIIKIEGNKIRSIIRTADNKHILRSTMFNISFTNGTVIIKGKGNGHGVGLCQWGAIHHSVDGKNYKQILSFYFPGTDVEERK